MNSYMIAMFLSAFYICLHICLSLAHVTLLVGLSFRPYVLFGNIMRDAACHRLHDITLIKHEVVSGKCLVRSVILVGNFLMRNVCVCVFHI